MENIIHQEPIINKSHPALYGMLVFEEMHSYNISHRALY